MPRNSDDVKSVFFRIELFRRMSTDKIENSSDSCSSAPETPLQQQSHGTRFSRSNAFEHFRMLLRRLPCRHATGARSAPVPTTMIHHKKVRGRRDIDINVSFKILLRSLSHCSQRCLQFSPGKRIQRNSISCIFCS